MSYVIQASPLTKLFMMKYQRECEADPQFVFNETPFDVIVPRSSGAILLTHNKPVHTANLLPVQKNRKKDSESSGELEALIHWLTGGEDGMRSEETDIYGVVNLRVDMDISSSIIDIASLAEEGTEESKIKSLKDFNEIRAELVNKARGGLTEARALADFRVKRAIKITHSNLLQSYETLKSEGKGVYSPSTAEAVGAYILHSELDKASENKRKLAVQFADLIKQTSIVS